MFSKIDSVVLVVDDKPSNLAVMRRALEQKGYAVVTAEGCDDAWDVFRRTPNIQILIADVRLRVGNGIELAKTLHLESPDPKILLTSGWDGDSIVGVSSRNIPPHSFLAKPFTAQQFVLAVQNVGRTSTDRTSNA